MEFKRIDDEYVPYFDLIMDCIKLRGKDIKETVEKIIQDDSVMEDCLEDNFLQFKLHSKKIRDEYEKAVKEEIEKTEGLWEKCDSLLSESKPKIEKYSSEILEIKKNVAEIKESVESIDIYRLERLMEIMEKFKNLSEQDKKILSELVEKERGGNK